MAGRTPDGWQDLRSESLLGLKGTDFEEFCVAVVKYEATDRHDAPSFDEGAGESVPDGGRDLLVTIANAPLDAKTVYQRTHHLTPLTEDPIPGMPRTRTAYSCKSGNNWLDLALRDARERGERPIEVLAEGGYFKLLINCRGKLDAKLNRGIEKLTPHEHLRNALWERLKQTHPSAPDPRLHVAGMSSRSLRLQCAISSGES